MLRALVDHEAATGNLARAIADYRHLLGLYGAGGPKLEPDSKTESQLENSLVAAVELSQVWVSMEAVCRRAGLAELASVLQTRRLDLWQHWNQKLPNNPFVLRQLALTK